MPSAAGDVAFTKHATPLEVARDGTAPASWATKNKVCGSWSALGVLQCECKRRRRLERHRAAAARRRLQRPGSSSSPGPAQIQECRCARFRLHAALLPLPRQHHRWRTCNRCSLPLAQSATPSATPNSACPDSRCPPPQDELRLLCPGGGCATLEEYRTCNIATAPAYAGGVTVAASWWLL